MAQQTGKTEIAVSVIVPFLDVAQHLTACLRSLEDQTLTAFEVICLDGGSKDGSREIARDFAAGDSRFRLAEGTFAPLAAARNEGIRQAKGKYIAFVDGDDTVFPQMLEKTVSLAEETEADVVCFPCLRYDSIADRPMPGAFYGCRGAQVRPGVFPRGERPRELFRLADRKPFDRLHRADFIRENGLSFTMDGYYDDIVFWTVEMVRAGRIACIPEALYTHTKRRDSRVHSRWQDAEQLLDPVRTALERAEADGCTEEEQAGLAQELAGLLFSVLQDMADPSFGRALLGKLSADARLRDALFRHAQQMDAAGRCALDNIRGALDAFAEREGRPQWQQARLLTQRKSAEGCRVSVILPVYQSELYLEEALDSLTGQTLRDLEILCIDDGSTDSSREILMRYAAGDGRIAVFSQPHLGVGDARNAGIREARGEYLYFMDSDDILEADALERAVRAADGNALDALYFDAEYFYDERCGANERAFRPVYARKQDYPQVTDGPALFVAFCRQREFFVTLWTALYRRRLISEAGILFEPGIVHNDTSFTYEALCSAKRAGYLKAKLYRRRVRPGSIITSGDHFRSAYSFWRVGSASDAVWRKLPPEAGEEMAWYSRRRIAQIYNAARKDYRNCTEYERGRMYALLDDGGLFRKIVAEPVWQEEERERLAAEKDRLTEELRQQAQEKDRELQRRKESRAYRLALRLRGLCVRLFRQKGGPVR